VTAERYAKILRGLGHRVRILTRYGGTRFDAFVALHARKSGPALLRFHRLWPAAPAVLVMTGTDLYRDIRSSRVAQHALAAASAIVVLQPEGFRELPKPLRSKTYSIVQSAKARKRRRSAGRAASVCVVGHLRYEKDPLRAALASRLIPATIAMRVTQAGLPLTPRFAALAREESRRNSRYRFVGEVSWAAAQSLIAKSDLMVISSRMEGGANVVCESIALGTPILASNIGGNTGILGARYPGLFPVGDTRALARLMVRAATDDRFYRMLRARCARLAPLVAPARERRDWAKLLGRLKGGAV
jgi:putative glycosyltransferase (TIGR04348 family)